MVDQMAAPIPEIIYTHPLVFGTSSWKPIHAEGGYFEDDGGQ
jgi:hypothetical protein